MSFNAAQALAICTATLNKRAQNKKTSYILHYAVGRNAVDGTMRGSTIKELITQFRESGGAYNYAFITKVDDVKVLRFFERSRSKKFFSMTRNGKRKK